MKRIPVQVNATTWYLITDGSVADSTQANRVGRWTTNDETHVVITPDSGEETVVEVAWRFNERNQLTLSQGDTELIVFAGPDAHPSFYLAKNVLQVDPDGDGDFEFPLACVWGLNPDGSLQVSIRGVESKIDGFVEDGHSRLRYRFYDKDTEVFANSLVFSGRWERTGDKNKLQLRFRLDDQDLEHPDLPLVLPGDVRVDPKRNHLLFTYHSASYGTRQLQFQGSLQLRPDWTLSFSIKDFTDASTGVRKSRIDVATTFQWDRVEGGLELFVGKTATPTGQKLEIGGRLQAKIGTKGLDWTFAYLKDTTGAKPVITVATAAKFVWKDGEVWLSYERSGVVTKAQVTAKLVKENFTLEGGVAIENDPQGRRLAGFLGVRW
jgi:hypothetical protein